MTWCARHACDKCLFAVSRVGRLSDDFPLFIPNASSLSSTPSKTLVNRRRAPSHTSHTRARVRSFRVLLIIITSTPRSYPVEASATLRLRPLGRRHLHRTCSNNNNTTNYRNKYVMHKTFCSRTPFRFFARETDIRCTICSPHRTSRFGNQLLYTTPVMLKTPVTVISRLSNI